MLCLIFAIDLYMGQIAGKIKNYYASQL